MKTLTFKKGGIHPPEHKTAPADKIIYVALPLTVVLPMRQHIGAEALPIVAKGDKVTRGQKIAEAQGKMSAPVHTPISGTVKAIGQASLFNGRMVNAVTIEATEEEHIADENARQAQHPVARNYKNLAPEEIIRIIADSGIVGLGGATFPTALKLTPPPQFHPTTMIINACECEPRLTCDDALMHAKADEIMQGVDILIKASKTKMAVIGIEANKPITIAKMQEAAKGYDNITVQPLKTKYPQGGEKQLIAAITGKEVPSGGFPYMVDTLVQNVATAYAVYQAVALGIPLTERVVTIDGCGNYLTPFGMPINQIPASASSTMQIADVVAGGPMMGQSAINLTAPTTKGLSGITVYTPLPYDPQPCIRCAECVQVCPMGLEPYLISTLGRLDKISEAAGKGAMDCIECGSCSYSCPSARPLLDYIRYAKNQIRMKK